MHGYTRNWRYYSAFRCDNASALPGTFSSRDAVCLTFKNSMFEGWAGGIASADGVRFSQDPELVLPV